MKSSFKKQIISQLKLMSFSSKDNEMSQKNANNNFYFAIDLICPTNSETRKGLALNFVYVLLSTVQALGH
jgi:hypothetical protein